MKHKSWDINEHATGRFKDGKPIVGVTFQNGLNDINPDGSFSPCDMTIEEVTQGVTYLKAKRGRWGEMRFGDSSHPNSFLVKIKNKGLKGISLKYTGANGNSMTANNGKPLCEFDNGISIESLPYYKGIKMDIIVNDPLTAPIEYPFSVKTYGQEYVAIEENGGLTFKGEDQDPIFIKPPYAVDSNGDIGIVTIHYTGIVNNLLTFKKVIDETWLRQAATPVRIDPDVTIVDGVGGGVIEDNWMWSALGTFNFGTSTRGEVIGSIADPHTALMKVDLSGYSGTVTLARFGVTVYESLEPITIDWYEVLRDWNELNPNGSSWNSAKEGIQAWTLGGCRGSGTDRNSVADGSKVSAVSSDFQIPISNTLATSWMEAMSNGITLDTTATSGDAVWRSCETAEATRPYFYMEYTEVVAVKLIRKLGRGLNKGTARGL